MSTVEMVAVIVLAVVCMAWIVLDDQRVKREDRRRKQWEAHVASTPSDMPIRHVDAWGA